MKNSRKAIARLSDQELIWLYADTRTREYYAELFLRYIPLLYGVALKYISKDAKDTVRSLYEKLPDKLASEAERCEDFGKWLYNETVSHISESLKNKGGLEALPAPGTVLAAEALNCIQLLEQGDETIRQVMDNGKARLTKPQKVCLRMFFLDGKSFADIADSAGYLIDNIKDYLMKGLEALSGKTDRNKKKGA